MVIPRARYSQTTDPTETPKGSRVREFWIGHAILENHYTQWKRKLIGFHFMHFIYLYVLSVSV
jgi:hypothetical protein